MQRQDSPWPPAGSTAKASFNLQNLLSLCNGGLHFTKKFCFVKLHHMAYFYMKRQDLQKKLYRFSKMSASQTTTKIVKCCKRKSHKARGKGLLHGGLALLRPHPRWGLRPQPWGGFAPQTPPSPTPTLGWEACVDSSSPRACPKLGMAPNTRMECTLKLGGPHSCCRDSTAPPWYRLMYSQHKCCSTTGILDPQGQGPPPSLGCLLVLS